MTDHRARELYPVFKKYVAEGPAGFDLAALADNLREFLQPVKQEMERIFEFSDEQWHSRDMNDTETAGFCKRAIVLYEAACPYEKELP